MPAPSFRSLRTGKDTTGKTKIIQYHPAGSGVIALKHHYPPRAVVNQFEFPQGRFSIPTVASWLREKPGTAHRIQAPTPLHTCAVFCLP